MSLKTFQESCADVDQLLWYATAFIESNMGIDWNMPAKKERSSSVWVRFLLGMNSKEPAELSQKILSNDSPKQLLTLLEQRLVPIIRMLRSRNLERGRKTVKISKKKNTPEADRTGIQWLKDLSLVDEREPQSKKDTAVYLVEIDRASYRSYLVYTLEDLLATVRKTNARKISALEMKIVQMNKLLEEQKLLLDLAHQEIAELKSAKKVTL